MQMGSEMSRFSLTKARSVDEDVRKHPGSHKLPQRAVQLSSANGATIIKDYMPFTEYGQTLGVIVYK